MPVAIRTTQGMFHGTTVMRWKFADPYFFFVNPRPGHELTFRERLPEEQRINGGRTAVEVANHVQKVLGRVLRHGCTR